MTTYPQSFPFAGRRLTRLQLLAVAVGVSALLLAGCGRNKDKAATQTAAKVNKEEITVHQINFVLCSSVPRSRPTRRLRPAGGARATDRPGARPSRRPRTRSSTATRSSSSRSRRRGARSLRAHTSKRSATARPSRRPPRSPRTTRRTRRCSRSAACTACGSQHRRDAGAGGDQLKKPLAGSKTFADFVAYLKATTPLHRRRGGARGRAVAARERRPVRQDEGRPGHLQRSSRWRAGDLPGGIAGRSRSRWSRRRRRSSSSSSTSAGESSSPTICRPCAAARRSSTWATSAAERKTSVPAASAPELPPQTTLPATLPASEVTAAPQVDVPASNRRPARRRAHRRSIVA